MSVLGRVLFVRHAQKASGAVVNSDGSAISSSALSDRGVRDSFALGATLPFIGNTLIGRVSTNPRTSQTLQAVYEGYRSQYPNALISDVAVEPDLTNEYLSSEFLGVYDSLFCEHRVRLMNEAGVDPSTFKTLSPDQQERFAEGAEEPVVHQWLTPDSALSMLCDSRDVASRFAAILKRYTLDRVGNELVDPIIAVTHKTITEPFLVCGALVRQDGGRVVSLQEIGGTLGLLDHFWVEVKRHTGSIYVNLTLTIRGQTYEVDPDTLLGRIPADVREYNVST